MLDKILKQDDEVMKILNVSTIHRIICETDKGKLSLQIRKGEKEYHLVLDAVPLSKQDNKDLMALLFPVKQTEIPQMNKEPFNPSKEIVKILVNEKKNLKKKLGRPVGSKSGITKL